MAKRKLSEEQILGVVKQVKAGRTAAEMAREVGVSTFTIYSWRAKYGGTESSEAQRLHHLEDENSRLKRLVAHLSFDREMLKALRRWIASYNFDERTSLRKSIRPVCGQSRGLNEDPRVPVLVTVAALSGRFF